MRRCAVRLWIMVLGFCRVGVAQVGDTIPRGFKGDDIVAAGKSLENVVYAKGRLQYIGPKEVLDKVYVFKLSDDAVLSSPDGVWLEETTKGINLMQVQDQWSILSNQRYGQADPQTGLDKIFLEPGRGPKPLLSQNT